jgi:hypothetical protein
LGQSSKTASKGSEAVSFLCNLTKIKVQVELTNCDFTRYRVTDNFARLMIAAIQVNCSGFGQVMIQYVNYPAAMDEVAPR